MDSFSTDLFGITEVDPAESDLRSLLASLEDADLADHPDVSLSHASGAALSVNADKTMIFERNGELVGFIKGLSDDRIIALWKSLQSADWKTVESVAWQENSD